MDKRIAIRYCTSWGYLPRAASLVTKVLDSFKTRVGEVALQPSSGGAFEITLGDDVIYSKLQTGRFPSEGQVLKDLADKL